MTNLDKRIRELCERAIAARTFPGCQVAYIRSGKRHVSNFGQLTYEQSAHKVLDETRYDVASITKSVPTATLLLMLVEAGRVGLDDKVVSYIPEMRNDYLEKLLVRHLLTYTVIFDFPKGLAETAKRYPEHLIEHLLTAPLMAAPGEKYFYTNGPPIIMGLIVERVYGRPLDVIAQTELFEPLALKHTSFNAKRLASEQVAPTEIDWRGEVRGQPHDETAWALAQQGQPCGAAGLFSTAGDLLSFAELLLNGGSLRGATLLQPKTVDLMHTNQLEYLGLKAGLGWEMGRPEVMGRAASDEVFMKSGFTGCLMVIDPERSLALVHLSNRTYPKRAAREPIQAFWRELNEAVFLGR